MIKLWIVLLILGRVGTTVGPLPYPLDECTERVGELNETLDGLKYPISSANGVLTVMRKDLKWECVLSMTRPEEGKAP